MEIITVIISGLFSSICVALPIVLTNKKEKEKEKNINDKATLLSLKCNIMIIYGMCRSHKQISRYQLAMIEELFTKYFEMGGNSFIHKIKEEIERYEVID